jgi:hypothetical protein
LLEGLANNGDSPVLPSTMTNTSPELEAVGQKRLLRKILASAIALLDFDDFNPTTKASTTHQQPPSQ